MLRVALLALVAAVQLKGCSGGGGAGVAYVCRTFPGLSREQQELCHRRPQVTAVAIQGLHQAVLECQHQFRWHRWNCSSLATKNRNPHSSAILHKGYRESAFAYAISAAGVAHAVARACSLGQLLECACASPRQSRPQRRKAWQWGGCSHNIDYGLRFSRAFLDVRERAGDMQSRINLHNNQAGRLALASNMQLRCKCHGMSGSCELKTCWKSAPDFRRVGDVLKSRYRSAVLVDHSNLGSGSPRLVLAGGGGGAAAGTENGTRRRRRPRKRKQQRPPPLGDDVARELLYFERSPTFCERDPGADFPGTVGRRCNRTSAGADGCASMCCGRGYNMARQRRVDRCHCRFLWCCRVACQNCTVDEWVPVCK